MEKNLAAYSAEQLIEMSEKYVGQFRNVQETDREEAAAVFVAAGIEALSRFDGSKANGGNGRGYQMAYAMGRVKNYFRHRSEIGGAENVSLSKEVKTASGEGYDKETLSDVIAGPDQETPEQKEMREKVAMAVASLPDQESAVMSALYFRGMKQCEIAEEMNLSVARIGQIEEKAAETLRRRLAEYAAA
jgi:RNA polymerase sigma factor (sigma-70 family)